MKLWRELTTLAIFHLLIVVPLLTGGHGFDSHGELWHWCEANNR